MLNPVTIRVQITRDLIWLKQKFLIDTAILEILGHQVPEDADAEKEKKRRRKRKEEEEEEDTNK